VKKNNNASISKLVENAGKHHFSIFATDLSHLLAQAPSTNHEVQVINTGNS